MNPPPAKLAVLDYGRPPPRGRRLFEWPLWLMTLWCVLIIAVPHVLVRGRDDPCWFAAMGLSLGGSFSCAWRARWPLTWYCFSTCLVVAAVGIVLPSLNRAT